MSGYYKVDDSKQVNLARYKSYQKDKIAIGEVGSFPDSDIYSTFSETDFANWDYYISDNNPYFTISKKQIETSFIKIGEQISKLVSAILPITLFLLFINQLRSGFFENSIQISSSTLTIVAFYFIFFAISVVWISRKKKIKLSIKNNHLYLSSFPTFYQKFSLDKVKNCYVNTFNHPSNQFDYLDSKKENLGQISVYLESGIAIYLNNGKKIFIGTSNSLKYHKAAYLQSF